MSESALIQRISTPLYRVRGWIKFSGIMSIVQGVLSILSVWGILFCWLPIWMGVLLYKAAGQIEVAQTTTSEEEMQGAMERLATYFKVFGITMVVMIVVGIIGIVAAIMIPAFISYQQAAMG